MYIKKGDDALVIAGKDKGKVAKVTACNPTDGKVTLENVNVVSRHTKPRSAQDKGGIMKKSAPIDASNVMVVCPVCKKATRVAHGVVEGKKVRICKKCGAGLDKSMTKAVKKQTKKAAKPATEE